MMMKPCKISLSLGFSILSLHSQTQGNVCNTDRVERTSNNYFGLGCATLFVSFLPLVGEKMREYMLQQGTLWYHCDIHEKLSGLASFGRSGKNCPIWTGLNRPVQNPSIVQNCPKLSNKQYFVKLEQNLFRLFILFREFIQVSILNQYSTVLLNFQYLHSVEA